MRREEHAQHCEELYGVRGDDIHAWIDEFFEHENYQLYISQGFLKDFNPYDHRKHRHHSGVLQECVDAFKARYSEDVIQKIFEQHIRDDYDGYLPEADDFDDPGFHRKYH